MSDRTFYDSIVPMETLSELTLAGRFVEPPGDWWAVMTDVVGSTLAIAEGRYKDVNLVGAAAIPALIEGLGEEVPYIFNGDGALLLIAPHHIQLAQNILAGLVHIADTNFSLKLRAGLFKIEELQRQGHQLEVGRLRLVGNRSLAQFRGTMVSELDRLLRTPNTELIRADPLCADTLALNNLSCRWHKQPARNGNILSILLLPTQGSASPITAFLSLLNHMTKGELASLNPVSMDLAKYYSVVEAIRNERRMHASILNSVFLRRLISILIAVPLFKWGLSRRYDWADNYLRQIATHSDFRKLDEALRVVIDCTDTQTQLVQSHLQQAQASGEIHFGIHRSDSVQLTCYVESLGDAAHVHFVDGSDGGYVSAAKMLKRQLETQSAKQ